MLWIINRIRHILYSRAYYNLTTTKKTIRIIKIIKIHNTLAVSFIVLCKITRMYVLNVVVGHSYVSLHNKRALIIIF